MARKSDVIGYAAIGLLTAVLLTAVSLAAHTAITHAARIQRDCSTEGIPDQKRTERGGDIVLSWR